MSLREIKQRCATKATELVRGRASEWDLAPGKGSLLLTYHYYALFTRRPQLITIMLVCPLASDLVFVLQALSTVPAQNERLINVYCMNGQPSDQHF